jgi:two-component sensor histidine kinase
MFDESRRRVRSMAMVHEKLYRTENMARVDFGEYLNSLALSLFRTYGLSPDRVGLEIDVKDLPLDINTAIPCGLLVSELVSNCLKHAFPEERKGAVLVGMKKQKDGSIELTVRDDGIGLQPEIDPSGSRTFGMQLVEMLVEQLRGKMKIDRSGGTLFTVCFKPLHYSNKV